MKKTIYLSIMLSVVLSSLSLISLLPAKANSVFTIDIMAGKNIDVGDITVTNNNDFIYITYEVESGWAMTETHLAIGESLNDIPQTQTNNPIPGKFEFSQDHNPAVGIYEYVVPNNWSGDNIYLAAHAVVSNAPVGESYGEVYATRSSNGTKGLYMVDVVNKDYSLIKKIDGDNVENGTGYTNGLAYDSEANMLYFTAPSSVNVDNSPLWYYDLVSEELGKKCDNLKGSIVGASFYGGYYYYIAENTNDLMKIVFNDDSSCTENVVFENFTDSSNFTFGDFAITADGMLYGSTRVSPKQFFSLDLYSDNGDYQKFDSADALDLQLAYGSNGKLYGVNHASGQFYVVDEGSGLKSSVEFNVQGFSDLASGLLFVPETESAWGNGERFTEKGNWGMYFTYDIERPVCEYKLHITSVNNNTGFTHEFVINSCLSTGEGNGAAGKETISNIVLYDNILSFKSVYDSNGYTWYPMFVLEEDYSLTFIDSNNSDNVWDADGTWE